MLKTIRGYILLIRLTGIRGAIRYERDRRAGATIDYSKVLSKDERATLGERTCPVPWEGR